MSCLFDDFSLNLTKFVWKLPPIILITAGWVLRSMCLMPVIIVPGWKKMSTMNKSFSTAHCKWNYTKSKPIYFSMFLLRAFSHAEMSFTTPFHDKSEALQLPSSSTLSCLLLTRPAINNGKRNAYELIIFGLFFSIFHTTESNESSWLRDLFIYQAEFTENFKPLGNEIKYYL